MNPCKEDLQIAREVKKRLVDKVEILDFRLYGSRARGTADRDSDMDLYIEVETLTNTQRRLINDIAWEVGFDKDMVIAPVVVTKDDLENSPFKGGLFYREVHREGIQL